MAHLRPRISALLALAAASANVLAQDVAGPNGKIVHIQTREERQRISAEEHALLKEGVEAEKAKDYAAAERAYLRMCTVQGYDFPPSHILLARLFDRTGKARKAYEEYRIVVVGDKLSASSDQDDPRVLAHFGDLSARFGPEGEAERAYTWAISNGRKYGGVPVAVARNDSLNALKAGAHTAAAINHYFTGQMEEVLPELDLAVHADGKNWIARIWRADAYRRAKRNAEATKEALVAKGLARGKAEGDAVQRMMHDSQIVDAEGHLPPAPVSGAASAKG